MVPASRVDAGVRGGGGSSHPLVPRVVLSDYTSPTYTLPYINHLLGLFNIVLRGSNSELVSL